MPGAHELEDDEAPEQEARGLSWAWDFMLELADGGVQRGWRGLVPQVKAEEDSEHIEGTTLFVASTSTPDRAMDVVCQKTWRLAHFRANSPILDNHNHYRVVGEGLDPKVPRKGPHEGRLMLRSRWDLDNPDMSIRGVGHQHIKGIRKAGSVGFRAGKKTLRNKLPAEHEHYFEGIEVETWWGGKTLVTGFLYEQCELLEFSSATIPMNPEALQRSILGTPSPAPGLTDKGAVHDFRQWLDDEANQKIAVDLLWQPILAKVRADDTFRRIVRAAIDAGPPAEPVPSLASLVLAQLEPS
jgi:hypothetical protein